MTDMLLVPDVVETEETTDPIHTHIVAREPGENGRDAHTIILEARINGTPVTALCGYTWVPSRNPENHPICQKCAELVAKAPLRS